MRVTRDYKIEQFETTIEEVRKRVRELADSPEGRLAVEETLDLFTKIR